MPFVNGKTAAGWGVYRPAPWHFVGIFASKADAEIKAQELGPDYVARYGDNRVGSDDFIETAA